MGLSPTYTAITDLVSSIHPTGNTAIGDGIEAGRAQVNDPLNHRPYARKTIVLMTDGIHNTGQDPEPQATAAAADGIVVHTVTFSTAADQGRMQQVAANGGGQHWHADDLATLVAAFRTIAQNVPTLLTE
ncbi:MAG: VWA domain-containing protein [Planctomycetaceae bacterium]